MEETQRYGVIAGEKVAEGVFSISHMVEKPERGQAPSNLAIMGRYVLSRKVFAHLENLGPGSGGEFQLTDALQSLLQEEPLFGLVYQGQRLDCGTKEGWLRATVSLALKDPALRRLILDVLRQEEVVLGI